MEISWGKIWDRLIRKRNCVVVERLGRYHVRRYKHDPSTGMTYGKAKRECERLFKAKVYEGWDYDEKGKRWLKQSKDRVS